MVKIEADASTAGGLRELVRSLNRMDAPDDAAVTGRGLRAGGRGLILAVEVDLAIAADDQELAN